MFPRYFIHEPDFHTENVYVRHDDAYSDLVLVTIHGEIHNSSPRPWPLVLTLLMVVAGRAREITQAEATALLAQRREELANASHN